MFCLNHLDAPAAKYSIDRGREGFGLPSLRTVRAVFPHTALQSAVSASGISRCSPWGEAWPFGFREQPHGRLMLLPAPRSGLSSKARLSRRRDCRGSAPCLAASGTCGALLPFFVVMPPPSYPPSLRVVSAIYSSHSPRCIGTMRVLTPGRPTHAVQVSPLTSLCLLGIPSPTTWRTRSSLSQLLQRDRSVIVRPGFTLDEQARRPTPPKRVRYPTGYPFASGCSPPRLAATQLRLVTGRRAHA